MAESCVIDKMGKEERMHIVRSFSRVYQNDCGFTFIKWQSVTSTFIVMLDVPLIIRFEANQYLSFVKNVYPWALLELIFLLCLKIMIVIGIVYIRHFFFKSLFSTNL